MKQSSSIVVVILAVALALPRFLGPPVVVGCGGLPWWLWWFYHWIGKC
jgi:hypothetical protein